MTSAFTGIALGLSLISLYLAWRSHLRAVKAELRADRLESLANEAHKLAAAAEKRAKDEARRKSVQFEFTHAAAPNGEAYGIEFHFRHTGHEEINFVRFDTASLSKWEVVYEHSPTIMRPGESMFVQLRRNRHGRLPESVTVQWPLPFEGEQVVPIPQDAFPPESSSGPRDE